VRDIGRRLVTLAAVAILLGQPWMPARRELGALMETVARTTGLAAPTPEDLGRAPFGVRGSATGLQPGARVPLTLRLTNPSPFPVRVTSVTVAVGDASPDCTAAMLSVRPMTHPVGIDAKSETTTALSITLAASTPDTCQGLSFPLTYGGSATRA
jgi:hypothetical protein